MDAGEGRLGVGDVGTQACGWVYDDQVDCVNAIDLACSHLQRRRG